MHAQRLIRSTVAAASAAALLCAGCRTAPSERTMWGMRASEVVVHAMDEDTERAKRLPEGPERQAALHAAGERVMKGVDLTDPLVFPMLLDDEEYEAAMRAVEAEYGPRETWPRESRPPARRR